MSFVQPDSRPPRSQLRVVEVIASAARCRYEIEENPSRTLRWTQLSFDDSAWAEGTTAIGFGQRSEDEADWLRTDIEDLVGGNTAVMRVRVPFEMPSHSPPRTLGSTCDTTTALWLI